MGVILIGFLTAKIQKSFQFSSIRFQFFFRIFAVENKNDGKVASPNNKNEPQMIEITTTLQTL
jgi:hypothetical protein